MRRRRLAAIGTGAALLVGAGVMTAPAASAYSYCTTTQGANWGSVSCQTTAPKNHWQLVLVCENNTVKGIRQTIYGSWHQGDGSDTLYCSNGYGVALVNVNNDN
ncbi:hypothetical protein [Streptomyces sp. FH025]|uniref:hypothetical protein n=1 Tax=Streptomyces sp. FH025 TaxID=2815937 RepID=UPI001A9F3636|nr:hypothetical protein [Streptomyces sp. FH025]MBO1415901.1 hypothetical protein [Streptomyces sp. FH025]